MDDSICPCCGTHFGYHDYATTYEELRLRWISRGAPWFSHARRPPVGWSAFTQLLNSGFATETGAPAESETVVEVDDNFAFDGTFKVTRAATPV
jgi:hypothetical protein